MILKVGRATITHDVLVFIRPVPILLHNVLCLIWAKRAFEPLVGRVHIRSPL